MLIHVFLYRMTQIANKHGKEMGETGQGLTAADQIQPNSEIATKWGK